MTAPTEEKLTSLTLWSSTLLTHVGAGERKRGATDHFLGNVNSSTEKLFQFAPAQ